MSSIFEVVDVDEDVQHYVSDPESVTLVRPLRSLGRQLKRLPLQPFNSVSMNTDMADADND